MTVEVMVLARDSEVAVQVTPIVPVEEWSVEGNLSAEQVETIIRAWRGEEVEGSVPISPVGVADVDGSLVNGDVRQFLGGPSNPGIDDICTSSCPSWFCSYEC